jgi:hypothetical protein
MASLLVAVDVLLICLLHSLSNSRLVRLIDLIEGNMMHFTGDTTLDDGFDETVLQESALPI